MRDREEKGMFFKVGTDMGIDLGTATVLVYLKGKGVILKEPSVVAIDKNNNVIRAVGEEARQMIGRTPGNIVAIRPLRDGVISDYDITEAMLKHFIKKLVVVKKYLLLEWLYVFHLKQQKLKKEL